MRNFENKKFKFCDNMSKKICIFLILIFCIIGAASAAEDVSTDVVDASADAVVVDAVSEDVSDSVESIDDEVEPAVVESASAQEENDDVFPLFAEYLCDYNMLLFAPD